MPTGPAAIDCRGQRWEVWLHQPTISPALLYPFCGLRFVLRDPPFYVVRVPMSALETKGFVPIRDYAKPELVAILEANLTVEQSHCPFCEGLVTQHRWAKGVFMATCENCGEYGVTEDAYGSLAQGMIDRAAAARVVRRRFDREGRVTFTTDQLDGMVEADARWRTLGEGLDTLVVALAREADGYQAIVDVRPQDWVARLGAESAAGVTELLRIAAERGYITSENNPKITPEGWERVEYHLAALPKARQVFVAMAFHPDTDEAFAAIKRGVERGEYYRAYRVDKAHYNDKIDDRILAEIRASSILIADYTLHRHGVYYETGFAQGLGVPIIWTCRKDDITNLHFDVRQWPMLEWDSSNELEAKVRDRIMALYPPPG